MSHTPITMPKAHSIGLSAALFTILFGFLMGLLFGAQEAAIKDVLDQRGNAALETVYAGDVEAKNVVVKKSFDYLIRAHLHGGAIGTAAVAAICVLLLIGATDRTGQLSALALGFGGLLYALFWLFAGLQAPAMGSTSAAKESLKLIAQPGSGLAVLGIVGTIYCVLRAAWSKQD